MKKFITTLITCSILFYACSMFGNDQKMQPVTGLTFSKQSVTLGIGGIEYIKLTVSPEVVRSTAKVTYEYDSSIISISGDNYGVTISGLKNGNTSLKAVSGTVSTVCVVSVIGVDQSVETTPQITSPIIALELERNTTKRVQVSLSNSIAADMADFTWTIDKPNIAQLDGMGQTGIVTALENGIAQVTVSHPKALYNYKFTVFVKPDTEKAYYITTQQNIITLDTNAQNPEKSISVTLVNGEETDNNGFLWTSSDSSVVSLTSNGNNGILVPNKAGTVTVSVSHQKSAYPLEIIVRVVSIVNNVYIEPSTTQVNINGLVPATVTAKLNGLSAYDISDFVWSTDTPEVITLNPYQDSCGISALKNGIAKIQVSHPNSKYPREILVMVKGHPSGSINTSMYITTTQNYIRTKVGTADTQLVVSLVGGTADDEKMFTWTVDNPEIITLTTTHGTVASRSALNSRTDGIAHITPKKEGVAVISVSHPKVLVPTEIMVKVLPTDALLTDPLYFTGPSVMGIVIGTSNQYTVDLLGSNKLPSDDATITWESENQSIVSLSAVNEKTATFTANGVGEAYVIIRHPKADNPKKVLVYTAATEQELADRRVIYTTKNNYNIVSGGVPETLLIFTINISGDELSGISWNNSNPAVAEIKVGNTNAECIIKGIAAGKTTVTATHPLCKTPVVFDVTVYPAGTDLGVIPSPAYFTTSQNLIQFNNVNISKTAFVTPIRLPVENFHQIKWEVADPAICEVLPNGDSATITSKAQGMTKISVSHPKAENILQINIRVGDEYIIPPTTTPYIKTSQDVLGLVKGQQGVKLEAQLINETSKGFQWSIDDTSIATINQLDNTCIVVPKEAGQARITVTNTAVPGIEKKVLVLVGNSSDELESLPYLSTSQNVILLANGSQQNVSVRIVNGSSITNSTYSWAVDNPSIAQVISSGNQAIIKGLSLGTSKVTVQNTACKYPLEIIVDVKNSLSGLITDPYITTSQNIITLTENNQTLRNLSVTLAGGSETDNRSFNWSIDRTDVISITANEENAVIRPVKQGECIISVTHPKAQYPLPIKVIVEPKVTNPGLYIKVNPADILTMKPADPEKTVTVSLIGGTAEDAYGFKWSADNYNSIKLSSSGATAVITPLAEGTTNIKITHPKAGFPAELQVRVTEYSTFAFSATNITMNEGSTQFVSMKVPSIENDYGGRVTYNTDNPKIVTITGTNKVAQLTAVASGTATVTATSPSGAKSEMMVYVKKAAEQTKPYITSATNVLALKTTDSARTVTAQLVGQGVLPTDQYNLNWEIEDTKIARLIGTSGSTVYVQPVAVGETTLKISHPNTTTVYRMYINVQGIINGLSLNKTYVSVETGKTIEVTATIDNGTSTDYKSINWSADKVNGRDVCTILGSGKTVAVYGLSAGQTTLTAEWNGHTAKCDVTVSASRQFMFDTQSMRVQPGQTKTFKYTLVPDDAQINWITNTNDYVSYSVDSASKTVSITGIAEAPSGTAVTTLTGNANSMIASINITTAWDYKFTLGKSHITAEPRYDPTNPTKFEIPYTVNPEDASIAVSITSPIATFVVDTANKKIILTPIKEGTATVNVTARNNKTGQEFPNMKRTCTLNFEYQNLNIVPKFVGKNGSFSRFDSNTNTIVIGDGEELEIGFSIKESNVEWNASFNLIKKVSDSKNVYLAGSTGKTARIRHTKDYTEQEYLVREWNSPFLLTLDGEYTNIELNPKTSFYWYLSTFIVGRDATYDLNCREGLYYMKRVPAKDNTRISISEYQSTPLWYRPYHGAISEWFGKVVGPWPAQPSGSLNAEIVVKNDKSIRSNVYSDVLRVVVSHNGKTQQIDFPVYTELRVCPFNQQ